MNVTPAVGSEDVELPNKEPDLNNEINHVTTHSKNENPSLGQGVSKIILSHLSLFFPVFLHNLFSNIYVQLKIIIWDSIIPF